MSTSLFNLLSHAGALDCMVCVAKHLSMDGISECNLNAHERTGCSEHISWDVSGEGCKQQCWSQITAM